MFLYVKQLPSKNILARIYFLQQSTGLGPVKKEL